MEPYDSTPSWRHGHRWSWKQFGLGINFDKEFGYAVDLYLGPLYLWVAYD